jgi:hypothetical protein
MLFLSTLLATLKNNAWLILAFIAYSVAIYGWGNWEGREVIKGEWRQEKQDALIAAHVGAAERQALADELAKRWEASQAEYVKVLNTAKKGLQNEIAKNAAFRDCHAGAGVVQLYRDVAAGKANTATSKPH